MVGLKVSIPVLRASASVLAVMLMTSGAVAEDEITAGTEPGDGEVSSGNSPPEDPIYVIDDSVEITDEGIAVGEPDPTGGEVVPDDGEVIPVEGATGEVTGEVTGDGTVVEDPDVVVIYYGSAADCGGCEYQSSAGPELPMIARGAEVQRSVARRSAGATTTAVKNSCLDPERYVAWLCDWQKDLGLIGQ